MVSTPPPTWRSRPSLLLLRADTTPLSGPRVSGNADCRGFADRTPPRVSDRLPLSWFLTTSAVQGTRPFGCIAILPDRVRTVSGSRRRVSPPRSSPTSWAGLRDRAASSSVVRRMVRRHPRCAVLPSKNPSSPQRSPSLGYLPSRCCDLASDPTRAVSTRCPSPSGPCSAETTGPGVRVAAELSEPSPSMGFWFPSQTNPPVVLRTVPWTERSAPSRDGGPPPSWVAHRGTPTNPLRGDGLHRLTTRTSSGIGPSLDPAIPDPPARTRVG